MTFGTYATEYDHRFKMWIIIDQEEHGIRNDIEKIMLVLWTLTVVLTSLIGDSIILLATIKYKAIKLHRVVITVMQHMAISDLLQTVFVVFPTTLSLIFGRWVLGEFFCYLQQCVRWFAFNTVTVFLTVVLTTLNLGMVKYPLRTGSWSSMFGHKICADCSCVALFSGFYRTKTS